MALLTRMNDYVSGPNLDVRYCIILVYHVCYLEFDYVTAHLTSYLIHPYPINETDHHFSNVRRLILPSS